MKLLFINDAARMKKQDDAKTRINHRWSREVTEKSRALDLEAGVFTWNDPRRIARSLKRSADASSRRKGTPYRSAMSMLNFYINRAGRNLPQSQQAILGKAKIELRKLFKRE